MTDDNVVKFPDNKIVREVTPVSFEKIKKFLQYHRLAKDTGAEFDDFGAVVFPNMKCFESFCEKLMEFNYDTQV